MTERLTDKGEIERKRERKRTINRKRDRRANSNIYSSTSKSRINGYLCSEICEFDTPIPGRKGKKKIIEEETKKKGGGGLKNHLS